MEVKQGLSLYRKLHWVAFFFFPSPHCLDSNAFLMMLSVLNSTLSRYDRHPFTVHVLVFPAIVDRFAFVSL